MCAQLIGIGQIAIVRDTDTVGRIYVKRLSQRGP